MIPEQPAAQNVEVQALKAVESMGLLRKSQASRWWVPKLDLYSSYGIPSLSDEFARAVRHETEWTLGVALTLDLGDAVDDRIESKARSYEAMAAEKRAAHRAREITAADHEIRHDLKLLHELLHDADKDITKAEMFLRLTESEYSRGVKNGPDLLDALEKYYEFRDRRVTLYREYYEAQAELVALNAKSEGE
jgi:outer membrane protein